MYSPTVGATKKYKIRDEWMNVSDGSGRPKKIPEIYYDWSVVYFDEDDVPLSTVTDESLATLILYAPNPPEHAVRVVLILSAVAAREVAQTWVGREDGRLHSESEDDKPPPIRVINEFRRNLDDAKAKGFV